VAGTKGEAVARPPMNTAEALAAPDNGTVLPDLKPAGLLLCRVRYFSDGALIGSKTFVDKVFTRARDRFTAKRKDGARRQRQSRGGSPLEHAGPQGAGVAGPAAATAQLPTPIIGNTAPGRRPLGGSMLKPPSSPTS